MTILASKRSLFAAVLLFGLLAMTARSATDPDLWWHLRTGQWIAETGHVPHSDPFSFTRAGRTWVAQEWLSEIIFYQLWTHAGPAALIVFASLVTTLGFLILYARCPVQPHYAAALTVLGAFASASCWGARPQMFTFTLASLLLWLIERGLMEPGKARPRLLLWIPPLFLFWLNLHAGFALGLAILILHATGLACEAIAGTTPWSQARPLILRVLAVTAVCFALVPLNPSGAQLYRYPFDTLRSSGMRSYIVEWLSPNFHRLLYFPFLLDLLLLLVALNYSRSSLKARTLLPLLFATLAALDAVRHIPIFILFAIPVIAAALPASSISLLPPRPIPARRRPAFHTTALVLLAAFAIVRWTSLARSQPATQASLFPQKAVAFLKVNPLPDRLFAYYDWGGYVIWQLAPQYRVFSDGRADLYTRGILHKSMDTLGLLHDSWRSVLDNWNVQTILVPPNTALAQALLLDPGWRPCYRDHQAIVFTRKG